MAIFRRKKIKFTTMAKLTLNPIVEEASGKVQSKGKVSHRRYGGKQYTYTWDPDTVIVATPARLIQRQAMKQANLDAKAILSDPEQTAQWQQLFQQQVKYANFRPFIVATRMAQIKAELTAR